ncbi:hypothetical protein UFOVP232_7 [uncultured Caudovirales phage]|jgi:hypothetical protein|uniref:Uncharacterized protein n=1 Tax=uncultured Caudovirales phage TaxID=2100421 RepID=A0A6J7WY11_9CAUD|nr:hypothetical protein UFOVP232_7 [uncultured Caudovirales phage]
MTTEFKGLTALRVAIPMVPVGHPKYEWKATGDVQSTWRKYGWKPLSEQAKRTTRVKPTTETV